MDIFAARTINITQGHGNSIPIAINKFEFADETNFADAKGYNLAEEIAKILSNDLINSGVFRIISHSDFIEYKSGIDHKPSFAAWQQINANLLLNAKLTRLSTGNIRVEFILWDNVLERQLDSDFFEIRENKYRAIAHKIADRIYKKITGYDGYFNTKIVYVSESGAYLKRVKRLAIMDQDGANHEYLTDGSDLVLTPRFSPNGKEILYLSYKKNIPQVYILDITTKKSKLIGGFKGMSFAPRFSPDGTHAVMSIAKNGRTHIYEIDLHTKKFKQLTKGNSINTSPSYSPDGKRIAFNSDAHGSRQILVMDRDGSNQHKISCGSGSYAEPNWSSNNLLAFTKINREYGFTIGVMSPYSAETNSNTERLITNGYLVESPAWTNNGRVIVFTKGMPPAKNKTKGLNRIYTINFTGNNERIIPTPHDASDPDWSKSLD